MNYSDVFTDLLLAKVDHIFTTDENLTTANFSEALKNLEEG
jgi:hypothetical protein